VGEAAEGAIRPGRGGAPQLLAESLPKTLELLGVGAALEDARLFEEWDSAVGPEIARVARPHRRDAGTLIVHVKSSAWMNELSLRRAEILRRVNAGRARRPVARIVFRIGDVDAASPRNDP
jgi:predicted nucleic acid-binding Zn ribbon protein